VQRILIALLTIGVGSWLGLNLQPVLAQLANRLGVETPFVVGVLLFWCLAFVAPYVFFRLRRPGG
jgi:hypothetical protein